MAFGLLFVRGFCVVNDGDKSVSVLSDIEDHVAIYIIGILEQTANFWEIVPTDTFYDAYPRLDFVRRIAVLLYCFGHMPARNDMHSTTVLHEL
jgi:hypothetical protein